jgi:hypothetical protein
VLGVVHEVAGDDDEVRPERVQAALGRGQDLDRQRLLRSEGRRHAIAESIDRLEPQRRLLVGDVDVRELRPGRERGRHPAGRRQVGALGERLAGPPAEDAVAVRIDERPLQRRAGRRAGVVVSGAAGEQCRPPSGRGWGPLRAPPHESRPPVQSAA